jgi:hypothetical protein
MSGELDRRSQEKEKRHISGSIDGTTAATQEFLSPFHQRALSSIVLHRVQRRIQNDPITTGLVFRRALENPKEIG